MTIKLPLHVILDVIVKAQWMERGRTHKQAMNFGSFWRWAYDSKLILSCRQLCNSFAYGELSRMLLNNVTLCICFDRHYEEKAHLFPDNCEQLIDPPPKYWKENITKIERLCFKVDRFYWGDRRPN